MDRQTGQLHHVDAFVAGRFRNHRALTGMYNPQFGVVKELQVKFKAVKAGPAA